MKLPNFFVKQDDMSEDQNELDENNSLDDDQPEQVHVGTKIKVISALMVVGVAMSVAYWVQEPDQTVTGNVLSATNERTPAEAEAEMNANTLDNLIAANDPVSGNFEVDISDFTYTPSNIEVEPGTTVTWTNLDQVAHTVTGDDFSSSSLKAGESFSYTFDQPGTYEYYCAFHPQMLGTITVVGSAVPATTEEEVTDETVTPDEEVTSQPAEKEVAEPVNNAADESLLNVPDTLNPAASDSLLGDTVAEPTEVMAMDANQMNNETVAAEVSPDELATTGPEEFLYLVLAAFILYINRRKLSGVFN